MNEYEKTITTAILAGLPYIVYESPDAKAKRRQAMLHLKTGREPWHFTMLSKAERKGKTPEEIRALRIEKWERQQQNKTH